MERCPGTADESDPAVSGRRTTVIVLVVVALVLAGGILAVGWFVSDRFLVPAPYALMPEFEILGAAGGTVTLPAPPPDPPQFARTRVDGTYNLLWEGGYGRLGPVVSGDGPGITREVTLVTGRSPETGDPARIDVAVFRRDPRRDHGIAFEDLRISGEAGDLAAWWIEGGDSAVLMLHGRRRADRTEALRILPTIVGEGHSVLVLSWRNHDASAPSPDGLYRYGATEYRDALAGVSFLAERGVERVSVYGFSTGATVGLEAVARWPSAGPELVGMVLDSPLVDFASSVRSSARARGLPDALARVALAVGRARTGVRWADLDQRATAHRLTVPLLVFAGTADRTIPIAVVDEFVARIRAPVRYERLDDVEHVEGWNVDPAGYEAAVQGFLGEVMARPRADSTESDGPR